MAEALQTALEEPVRKHPADDPRVFDFLVKAATEMIAVICAAPTPDKGEEADGDFLSVQQLPTPKQPATRRLTQYRGSQASSQSRPNAVL